MFRAVDKSTWDDFVLRSNNGSVFNTTSWLAVWARSYYNACPFFLILGDNTIKAGIPIIKVRKFGFTNYYSMPYDGYGGVLYTGDIGTTAMDVLSCFAKLAKGRWGMLSLTDFQDNLKVLSLSSLGFKKRKCTTHILPFSDSQKIWENYLTSQARQMIRQSQTKGVSISLVTEKDEVKECYKMFQGTAQRHGKRKPEFPLDFYMNVFESMGKYLRWTIAKKSTTLLATTIHFTYKDTITYWDGASYRAGLSNRPNHALIWETIRWGCENDYKYYDLGASPQGALGLIKFKQSWGAKKYNYCVYYKQSVAFETLKHLHPKFLK